MTSHSVNSSDNDKVNSKNHNKKSSSSPRSKKKTTMPYQAQTSSGNESIINSLSGKDKVRFSFVNVMCIIELNTTFRRITNHMLDLLPNQ